MKFLSSVPVWLLRLILKVANFLLHFLYYRANIFIMHDRIGCPFCEMLESDDDFISALEDLPE